MRNKYNVFALILLSISLANIITSSVAGHPIQQHLFNSDALYISTVITDLISKNGNINDWFLTPAPYFFPDYPLFLLAYLSAPSPYSQIILFSVIQAGLTFVATWLLARQIQISNALFTAAMTSIVFIWLALTSMDQFSFLFLSGFHYGIFLISIVFVGLWLRCVNPKEILSKSSSTFEFWLIAILAFLSALSDNLFIVQLVVPLVTTTLFVACATQDLAFKKKLPLVLTIVFGVLGSVAYKFIVTNQTRYSIDIGLKNIISNLNDFYVLFYSAIAKNPILGIIFLIFIGAVLFSFFQLVKRKRSNPLILLTLFSFLSFCSTFAVFTLATNLQIISRYVIPSFFWPVIVDFFFLTLYLGQRFYAVETILSLLVTLSLSFNSYKLLQTNGFESHYYPDEISCIDNALEDTKVSNGIAQYWDAKYFQNFSRLDLNIAQHSGNLGEYHWITSSKYYKQSYDFAIISKKEAPFYKISTQELRRLNGSPALIKNCGSRLIYIYGKNKLFVKKNIVHTATCLMPQ